MKMFFKNIQISCTGGIYFGFSDRKTTLLCVFVVFKSFKRKFAYIFLELQMFQLNIIFMSSSFVNVAHDDASSTAIEIWYG